MGDNGLVKSCCFLDPERTSFLISQLFLGHFFYFFASLNSYFTDPLK